MTREGGPFWEVSRQYCHRHLSCLKAAPTKSCTWVLGGGVTFPDCGDDTCCL